MKSSVLLLLCLCAGCFSNPVPEFTAITVYNYTGCIDTFTSADPESLARWVISGTMTMKYRGGDLEIVQFSNLKTGVFNGHRDKLPNMLENVIPDEAKILEQPFVFNLHKDFNYTWQFKPNEPKWSINMKRGMMSVINFDYRKPPKNLKFTSHAEYIDDMITQYGKCTFTDKTVSASFEDGIVYERVLKNCTDFPYDLFTNSFRDPEIQDILKDLDYNFKKVLHLKEINGSYGLDSLVTNSHLRYKNCKSCKYSQNIYQEQRIKHVINYKSDETLDFSEYTVIRGPRLEIETSKDFTSGRHVYEKDPSIIAKTFVDMYEEYFNNTFSYAPPNNFNISKDGISEIFTLLMTCDLQSLKAIEEVLTDRKDFDIGFFFIKLVPYVGTNSTVEFLMRYLQNENLEKVASLASRILLNFPRYIHQLSDEMLVEIEPMIKYKHIVENKMMKKAAYFGFARAVGRACRQNKISKENKQEYINMFNNQFLEGQDYEERMLNLLTLINMGECLEFDFMSAITTNTSESRHLRLLAMSGFKEYLSNNDKLYDVYWPIVQKKSEPFEIRVAMLDLLLYNNVNEKQFKSILEKYSGDLNEPDDRQLANYVLTALHSNCMGEQGEKARNNNNIRPYPKDWATGHYRLSYADLEDNVGAFLESRIITDPSTNIINFAQLSFNSYAMSFDLGTYTAYINFHGFVDVTYLQMILNGFVTKSIPDLVELLKNFNFNIGTIDDDINVDIVLFVDNSAVYMKHIDKFDSSEWKQLVDEFEEMLLEQQYLQYPLVHFLQIPSELGTTMMISTTIQNLAKLEPRTKQFRNSWSYQSWMEVYNPILDTYISNFKYQNQEIYVRLNMSFTRNFLPKVSWYNDENAFSKTWDNNMGTGVDNEEILQQYCQDCKAYTEVTEIPFKNFKEVTLAKYLVNEVYNIYLIIAADFKNKKYLYNADSNQYAAPLLLVANMLQYEFWVGNELVKGSIKNSPNSNSNNITQSTLTLKLHGNHGNNFGMTKYEDAELLFQIRNLEEEVISDFSFNISAYWSPSLTEENETRGIRSVDFRMRFREEGTTNVYKGCGYGALYLPNVRSDRLSIAPYEPVSTDIVFYVEKSDFDENDCSNYTINENSVATFIITPSYAPNDKKTILENEKYFMDYEQCQNDSIGLKYTAPTRECERTSNRLTEFGKFKFNIKGVSHKVGQNFTNSQKSFQYSRVDDDNILIEFGDRIKLPVYYPSMTVNPLRMGYNEDASTDPENAKSVCIITPSKIQQFSGKFVPNESKKWLAYGECNNITTRALEGRTIDDKHVGFTFHTKDKILEGTVTDGKLKVTLNGKPVTELLYSDDLPMQMYSLADDVIYLVHVSGDVGFYYNTEYIAVRVNSIYSNLLCGVCN